MHFPASPVATLQVIDLLDGGAARLQAFFDANPFYFESVNGEPARADEAWEEIHEALPPGYSHTHKYVFGYADADGALVAMANVVSDLLAQGVWHVGTFIVATDQHGSGLARTLYQSIEDWARRGGAEWMRLGVVQGHQRAEAFWASRGYTQVAQREGVVMGQRTNTIRVMAKPLAAQALADYYERVERDRPLPGGA